MNRFFEFALILLFATASINAQVGALRATSLQYDEQWKVIDKLMDGVLPQSALPEIEKVRQAALKDKAYGHWIKAVMTRNTCLQLTEKEPQATVINHLLKDAETVSFPARAVIHSLTAEAYLNYYNQNRWKIYERTALAAGVESDDIETWDATRLIREITHYYQFSLEEPALSQKTSINDFSEALQGDASTRYLRPTLYDFLAHRAIDACMNFYLQVGDFSQIMNNPAYFGEAHDFVKINIMATDSLTPTSLILKLFQELIAFRLTQTDVNPLIDVNLKRFAYLKDHGNFDDVNVLYEDAMKNVIEQCVGQKIWGKAACSLAVHYKRQGDEQSGKHSGNFFADAVNLCHEIEKKAPLMDDRRLATEMIKEITQPEANIFIEKNLIPHQPSLALVSYKNLRTACLNIYRCVPEEIEELYRSKDLKEDAPKFLSKLEKQTSLILELPLQGDYRKHSFETKIDPLPSGNYLLAVSDKPNPEKDKLEVLTFQSVQVTNIKMLQRLNADGNTEVYAVNARTGKPLPEALVTIVQRSSASRDTYIAGDTLRTDSNGTVLVSNTGDNINWGNRFRVEYGGDELIEDKLNNYFRREQSKNEQRTVFFTDRAIYRPGQTLYYKGILYETDNDAHNAIQPNTKTIVQLIDVNGKEVTRQELTTSEYGSFNGSFTLPQGLLNGQMRLNNEHGNIYFRVEEYKRPAFEVTMNPITANYVPGDTVTMTGTAIALAGYPVDGAKVAFKVVRLQQFRPVRRMIYPPQYENNRHIVAGTVYTDDKGGFTVRFPAKAEDIKPDDNGIYRYQMTADVTDVNGETQSSMQEVMLGRVPLLVDWKPLSLPLSHGEGESDVFEYPFRVTNLNGNDVAAEVQVDVWALKNPGRLLRDRLWQLPDMTVIPHDEFTELFPNDPYVAEDQPETYEKTGHMASFVATAPKDTEIDLGMLRDAPSGWYFIRMKITGEQNVTVTDSAYIQLRHNNAGIMNMKDWLTVVKDSGEPGDMAVFRVAGGNDSTLVRYDVLFKNRLVERKWMTVGRIPQELRFPIDETYRGGFAVAFAMVQDNREYTALHEIKVPYSNKDLNIAFTSFRGQLLPGEKEKWTLTVKNKKGESEAAEMVAALYDASLDMFAKHDWRNYFYPVRSHWPYGWNNRMERLSESRDLIMQNYWRIWDYRMEYERLRQENWGGMMVKSRATAATAGSVLLNAVSDAVFIEEEEIVPTTRQDESPPPFQNEKNEVMQAAIPLRTNFSETAFFYPALRTNEKGELSVEFTIPEALTRWNLLGFAHTKNFKTGNVTNSLITQKQVAISANLPRFFRTGDTLILSAKVNNLTEKDLNGNALLRLYNAFTMQPVDAQMLKTAGTQSFSVKAGQTAAVQWRLVVPGSLQAVTCRLTAQAGNHTDGEERSVPVLSNRTLVTETMPFMVRGDQRKDFRFIRFSENNSTTLKHHRVTLEYTSNPAWYAVQALPYLMEYPYECAEQVFSRFYANTLAGAVANSSPKVKQIFDRWSLTPDPSPKDRGAALLSNLEKNQELKQALLEETPWVMQAANETERKKRTGLLFDLNRMANEQKTALEKMKAMQGAGGGFPWFAGMPEDRFVTQHIVAGLEHLRILRALPRNEEINNLIVKAMAYCDARISEDFTNSQRRDVSRNVGRPDRPADRSGDRPAERNRERLQINSTQIHYLYVCSFSRHYAADQQAFDFYMQQAERSWTQFNICEQAMTALTMHRFGKPDVAQNILRSLKERAQMSDEMGMYWTDNRRGYFWNEAPVETQAMLISAFNEAGSDVRAVAEMKIWLLRNRQTTDWKTTKATAEAIYALLSTDDDMLGSSSEPLDIRISGKPLKNMTKESLRPEAGTGYVNISWYGSEVNRNLANLRITNPNSNIAWGAMYWQYYEDMDKISSSETNLQMSKQMFIKRLSLTSSTGGGRVLEPVTGDNCPQVGDVVTVRLILRADRDFEYVHLKDMRAAGFEPANTLSGYRFQGGLGYYESIKDASVNFFISYLRQGTYVFEYDLRVSNAGDFSNGITAFQCMYAPEFSAHSEGLRVSVN